LQHTYKIAETLATCVWNTCETLENSWKPLQTYATSRWNTCNIRVKHIQHPDETLATNVWKNIWNIWNIHLKHTYIAIATCAISWSTFATYRWNICNI
jgi:hypothetical protein